MQNKTNMKAADLALSSNHNRTVSQRLRIQSRVKVGFNPQPDPPRENPAWNHNQTVARVLKIQSGVKVGFNPQPDPPADNRGSSL